MSWNKFHKNLPRDSFNFFFEKMWFYMKYIVKQSKVTNTLICPSIVHVISLYLILIIFLHIFNLPCQFFQFFQHISFFTEHAKKHDEDYVSIFSGKINLIYYYVSPFERRETYCFSLIFFIRFFRFFCFFSAMLVRTITFLSFQIGQLYLVCGCMTIRRCVTYRNDLRETLTFDLKVK